MKLEPHGHLIPVSGVPTLPFFMPKPVNTACFAFPSARTVLFQSKTANAWILIICIARAAAFVKMFVHSLLLPW